MKRHLVVNIRGTNGSGKSHLVHRLIKDFHGIPLRVEDKVWGYKLDTKPATYIVGRYETPAGGCDTILDIENVNQLITVMSQSGNVVFEGLVATGIAGRWVKLAKSLPNTKWVFLTLNTPLKKCVQRVTERRAARGVSKPMNAARADDMRNAKEGTLLYAAMKAGIDPVNYNIVAKARAVQTSHLFLAKAGMDVRRINYKKSYEIVVDLLGLKK